MTSAERYAWRIVTGPLLFGLFVFCMLVIVFGDAGLWVIEKTEEAWRRTDRR